MLNAKTISMYCDESCHLLNDHIDYMGFAAIHVPKENVRTFALQIRDIKKRHKCTGELKWVKVSPTRLAFYEEIIAYFFSIPDIKFRALVVNNKSLLNHSKYNSGSHDTFYYKMYYYLLSHIIRKHENTFFEIYLDIKSNNDSQKIFELRKYLSNTVHDFEYKCIQRMQTVRSHEVELLQIVDFLLGAVMYATRLKNDLYIKNSDAKKKLIELIQQKSGFALDKSTEPWEEKFNLFHFTPRTDF